MQYSIGVLLVNYRQWDLTEKCVASLLASRGVRVMIALVDNNTPGPVPLWVGETPEVLFHGNPQNTGLTAGNNQAYRMLSGHQPDFVLILNNDTEVEPDALAQLSNHLLENGDTGIAAPAVTFASQPDRIWSAGGVYSNWRMRLRQIYGTAADLPEHPQEMDQVTGCAMMMRWGDYARAGMQDPDLFVYYEDTELCFKVRRLGLTIHLVPKALVRHHVSVSVGGVYSPFAIYFTHRNRCVVALRYLPAPVIPVFLLYYLAVTVMKTVAYPVRRSSGLVRWMWLGFLHGIRNRPDLRPGGLFPGERHP